VRHYAAVQYGVPVITDSEGVPPDFMAWLNRQLAMCVKRLRRWDEVVWEPNVAYSAVELGGPSEVLDKVAYVLLNPVSAALVRSPETRTTQFGS